LLSIGERLQGDEIYPRYKIELRPRFKEEWETFVDFLTKQKIGEPSVQQCEMTYVNDLLEEDDWKNNAESLALFSPCREGCTSRRSAFFALSTIAMQYSCS
jgi:hypothetical protein